MNDEIEDKVSVVNLTLSYINQYLIVNKRGKMKLILLSVILSISATVNSQDMLSNMLNAPINNWTDSYYGKGLDEFINQPNKLIQYQFSELVNCETDYYQNAFTLKYQGRMIDDGYDYAIFDMMCIHSSTAWRVVLVEKPAKDVIPLFCGLDESTTQWPCFSDLDDPAFQK